MLAQWLCEFGCADDILGKISIFRGFRFSEFRIKDYEHVYIWHNYNILNKVVSPTGWWESVELVGKEVLYDM